MTDDTKSNTGIAIPPKGLAILTLVGPSFVWASEYIGSGEVILATRAGAILGPSILWAILIGIFLKYWIGMSGARYTVCTGEGMIDMFARIPGPRNWVVWLVLIAQFASATVAIGSIASAAGVFVNSLIPISPYFGGFLFLVVGAVALVGTLIGILAGWPRLLADSFRICFHGFKKRFSWKIQFRIFLVFFFCTNMIIVYTLGLEPVILVKLSAILDGLLLTPLQAIWVAIGLYYVMPRLLSKEAKEILKPHWLLAVGLGLAFLVFGYFCVFQIPFAF